MRSVALALLSALLLFGMAAPAWSCFGPKLYIGVGNGAESELLYALVSLYVKEKTGVESVRVDLGGNDPRVEVAAARLDLALSPVDDGRSLLKLDGFPLLLAGKRPHEDLQFTTVVPALRKLSALLTVELLRQPLAEVRGGASPAAIARQLLRQQGWL